MSTFSCPTCFPRRERGGAEEDYLHRVLALLRLSLHHATPRNLQQHDLLSLANIARSQQVLLASHPVLRCSPLLHHLNLAVEIRLDVTCQNCLRDASDVREAEEVMWLEISWGCMVEA